MEGFVNTQMDNLFRTWESSVAKQGSLKPVEGLTATIANSSLNCKSREEMHTLVQMHYLTRKEFERNLRGLTDEDARRRIEPMNCISWIIAHVAWQYHTIFVDWPQGRETDSRYKPYGYGSPTSRPPLEEAMTLWRDACQEADVWLQAATRESLQDKGTFTSPENENWGTLLVRSIFHTWCHLGEISSIRQILGHRPPEFVNMYDWSYDGT